LHRSPRSAGRCHRGGRMSNKTPREEHIREEQEAREKEREREERAEEERLDDEDR